MSSEFEASQEVCGVLQNIDQNLDRMYENMPSQRERIATAAMQGLIVSRMDFGVCAMHAVKLADALIAELNKKEDAK